ncbi:hypothetical protein Pint_09787 [Pistacia integerrima]|uniref:Uncharacterized protein n=1 Tax=Pistacia integerrima TaxID=434235 RepID=A0ACC0XK12_9ROSI|nr:hypothetical protein Pint_09787 [Pistacia integerrima]
MNPKLSLHAPLQEAGGAAIQTPPSSSSGWSETRLFLNLICSQLMNSLLMVFFFLFISSHSKPSDPPDSNPLLDPEPPNQEPGDPETGPGPGPGLGPELIHVTTESANGLSSSKRWTDIFKKGDKKAVAKNTEDNKDKEKEKKREKKSQSGVTSAELNINIWPFSRSRSAGNGRTRPRLFPGAPGNRKVSSAPCSRSNSAGESMSRKWPSSPGRPGVHLGRSSPIWQVKRGGGSGGKSAETLSKNSEKVVSKKEVKSNKPIGNVSSGSSSTSNNDNNNGKVRVLNLNVNVPMCIGYRHHLSCRSDENSALRVAGVANNKSTNTTAASTPTASRRRWNC